MPNCSVPDCKARQGLHRFPRDVKMRKQWLVAIGLDEVTSDNANVCDRHFKQEDYKDNMLYGLGMRKLLKPTAVPSVFNGWSTMETTAPVRTKRSKACKVVQSKPERTLRILACKVLQPEPVIVINTVHPAFLTQVEMREEAQVADNVMISGSDLYNRVINIAPDSCEDPSEFSRLNSHNSSNQTSEENSVKQEIKTEPQRDSLECSDHDEISTTDDGLYTTHAVIRLVENADTSVYTTCIVEWKNVRCVRGEFNALCTLQPNQFKFYPCQVLHSGTKIECEAEYMKQTEETTYNQSLSLYKNSVSEMEEEITESNIEKSVEER